MYLIFAPAILAFGVIASLSLHDNLFASGK